MANKKVDELQRKSRLDALKMLRASQGLPMPPRKAVAQAKKATKERGYLVSPYPQANPIQLYNWAKEEWNKLGRWQSLAAPAAIIAALLTWEKERGLQAEYASQSDKIEARRLALSLMDAPKKKQKRKLLGFIPLPGK